MKTIKITNEELFNNKVVDVELDFHQGDMHGDVAIEVVGEAGERCFSGQHGQNDYEEDFGFQIVDFKEFLICDKTENSGKPYIAECGSNTGDPESAMKFETQEEAENYIKDNEWSEWAYVESY